MPLSAYPNLCVSAEMRRDPGQPEVERRNRIAEALRPGKDEAAHAAVDMEAEVVLERELRHLLDRIDEPVRVVAGRADDRDGVRCDVLAHPADVGPPVVAHRRLDQRDPQHVRGLLERDVRGDGDDDLGARDPLLHPAALAVDEHRVDQALGAAERDHPADLLARVVLATPHRR